MNLVRVIYVGAKDVGKKSFVNLLNSGRSVAINPGTVKLKFAIFMLCYFQFLPNIRRHR